MIGWLKRLLEIIAAYLAGRRAVENADKDATEAIVKRERDEAMKPVDPTRDLGRDF